MTSKPVMPAEVLIGTIRYEIRCDPDEWIRVEHKLQRKGDYGHTEHMPALIHLNPEAGLQVRRLTLWHEVLHALAETVMGAPDWRHLGKTKEDREEAVIRAWEHPTLAVLRDNPDLAAYLTAR